MKNRVCVLLIEDSSLVYKKVQNLLCSANDSTFYLDRAASLAEGLKLLEKDIFDVLLLDLGLPDSEGLDTLRKVCEFRDDIPIVVFTASDDDEMAMKAVQSGAQDYITKEHVRHPAVLKRSLRYAIERRILEANLLEHEKYISDILFNLPIGMLLIEARHHLVQLANPIALMMLEASETEVLGQESFRFFVPNQGHESWQKGIDESLNNLECEMVTINGSRFSALLTIVPVTIQGTRHFLASFIDITERIEAAEALRKSEERFAYAINATGEGLWDFNVEQDEIYFSPRCYSMLGYEPDSFKPDIASWEEILNPVDLQRFSTFRTFLSGKFENYDGEFRFKRKDGTWCWIEIKGEVVKKDPDGKALRIVGTNTDITTKVLARDQLKKYATNMEQLAENRAKALVHSDRLATLGTMSAGIAHEINNPCTFISTNIQLLSAYWKTIGKCVQKSIAEGSTDKILKISSDEVPSILHGMTEGVRRITEIVQGLKQFSRKGSGERPPSDINLSIANALLLCKNSLKYGFEVIKDIEPDLPLIPFNSQKIEQVLINLINNGVQAMGKSGTLTISARLLPDMLQLSFKDTGPGIPEDRMKSIWDPFFTTKEVGIGTGLGLSISHGIIEEHNGKIWVENNQDAGATFFINLPRNLPENTAKA